MKFKLCIIFVLNAITLAAQDAKPGDIIQFGMPSEKSYFKNVFKMQKTRFPLIPIPYDTITGKGFHAAFFTGGDFNASYPDSTFEGKTFTVISLEYLRDTEIEGNSKWVLFAKANEPDCVFWIDLENALISKELVSE